MWDGSSPGQTTKGTITTDATTYWYTATEANSDYLRDGFIERNIVVTTSGVSKPITATVSGQAAADFTLSTATLPAEGGTIVAKYIPTVEVGDYPLLTLHADDAEDCVVTLRATWDGKVLTPTKGIITTDSPNYWFSAISTNNEFMTKGYIGRDIIVTGQDISGEITASLTGPVAKDFTISPTVLPATGGQITVEYHPTIAVNENPRLVLSAPNADDYTAEFKTSWDGLTVYVATIIADDTEDNVEYYTLQGVRLNTPKPMPGIYLMRRGGKVYKIMIR